MKLDSAIVEANLLRLAKAASSPAPARTAAEQAVRDWRKTVPRDTGRLAGSARVVDTTDGAEITVSAPYAADVEYRPGGGEMRQALADAEQSLKAEARRRIRREASRTGDR